jgi:hypothetical protein
MICGFTWREKYPKKHSLLWLPTKKALCIWSSKINKENNNLDHEVPFAFGDQLGPCVVTNETSNGKRC